MRDSRMLECQNVYHDKVILLIVKAFFHFRFQVRIRPHDDIEGEKRNENNFYCRKCD